MMRLIIGVHGPADLTLKMKSFLTVISDALNGNTNVPTIMHAEASADLIRLIRIRLIQRSVAIHLILFDKNEFFFCFFY